MSETTIINCDICGSIFEPECGDDYFLTYFSQHEDDEDMMFMEHQMDICRECFIKHILPLRRDTHE